MRVMRLLADTTNRDRRRRGAAAAQHRQSGHRRGRLSARHRAQDRRAVRGRDAARRAARRRSGREEEALARFGLDLGFAFQIADDVLDYVSDAGTLGKNIGDDLAEGKPTLPLIYAIEKSAPAEADALKRAITNGGLDALPERARGDPRDGFARARARACARVRAIRARCARGARTLARARRARGARRLRDRPHGLANH